MTRLVYHIIKKLVLILVLITLLFTAWVYFSTFHPEQQQREHIIEPTSATSLLAAGQTVKVLSWNVQFMASNRDNYFFYDGGSDGWPTLARVKQTSQAVAEIIAQHDPDIVLLQEVDENADRTYNLDQQQLLNKLLSEHYPYQSSSIYWQASFVPHPQIMGRVGMKLVALSKYPISKAIRHRLPEITSDDIITRQFNLKRAMQELSLPINNGTHLTVINTHLSAFAQGSNTMQLQITKLKSLLDNTEMPWLIAGDYNLLASAEAFAALAAKYQSSYNSTSTELGPLLDTYPSIPSLAQINGDNRDKWFTYMPSDDPKRQPDRTIDYIFYSPLLTLGEHQVVITDTQTLSDHLPIVASFTLPK